MLIKPGQIINGQTVLLAAQSRTQADQLHQVVAIQDPVSKVIQVGEITIEEGKKLHYVLENSSVTRFTDVMSPNFAKDFLSRINWK